MIGDDVRRACSLPSAPEETAETAFFPTDSAQLDTRGDRVLGRVGACVASGAIGAKKLAIVGYADRIGETRYNDALGLYRAQATRLALLARGVPDARIVLSTRGERDARGPDDVSSAHDRRVEIHLGEPAAEPASR